MNKEIIICIIIIILVISLDLVSKNFTKNAIETINGKLGNMREELVNEDTDNESIQKMDSEIEIAWKNKYEVLAFYIEHDELEKVETELTSLRAKIEVNKFDDGVENLDRCVFILNHIKDKYGIKVKNIF